MFLYGPKRTQIINAELTISVCIAPAHDFIPMIGEIPLQATIPDELKGAFSPFLAGGKPVITVPCIGIIAAPCDTVAFTGVMANIVGRHVKEADIILRQFRRKFANFNIHFLPPPRGIGYLIFVRFPSLTNEHVFQQSLLNAAEIGKRKNHPAHVTYDHIAGDGRRRGVVVVIAAVVAVVAVVAGHKVLVLAQLVGHHAEAVVVARRGEVRLGNDLAVADDDALNDVIMD